MRTKRVTGKTEEELTVAFCQVQVEATWDHSFQAQNYRKRSDTVVKMNATLIILKFAIPQMSNAEPYVGWFFSLE